MEEMTNYVFEESCTNIVLYIKFYISLDIHVEAIFKRHTSWKSSFHNHDYLHIAWENINFLDAKY